MKTTDHKPDTKRVLGVLKDFQRRTMEYAFQRLYIDADRTSRFLIADEVGLGKTLVARGLIARVVDLLWDKVDRIDVVYICSNADIARQNIARLNILEEHDFTPPDRLTLLPLHLPQMDHEQHLNFVTLTPETSFDPKSRGGKASERALLYRALKKAWDFGNRAAPVNVLSCYMDPDNFEAESRWIMEQQVEEKLLEAFVARIAKHDEMNISSGKKSLRQRFNDLYQVYSRRDSSGTAENSAERVAVIGELRSLLARTCLEWLKPDLIILDEFQRFKHLMDPTTPAGQLANELFEYSDEYSSARVVLLSATPYKMYTLHHEEDGDNHYGDFIDTLKFLFNDPVKTSEVEQLLDAFAKELHHLPSQGMESLLTIKEELELRLRKVMARTERLARSQDRNGMLKEIPPTGSGPEVTDIKHYVAHARVSHQLKGGSVIEYWKSAPYLLNFMEEYRLKHLFKQRTDAGTDPVLRQTLLDSPHVLLSHKDLKRYRTVDPCNARLRGLLLDAVECGAWKLLWMPPALPYYHLKDEYAQKGTTTYTKRLVFSCWHIVPKVIAALASYEAERRCALLLDEDVKNTTQERKKRGPLLRFAFSDGRLTGMPVLGLIYPVPALAEATDPLRLAMERPPDESSIPDFDEIFAAARSRVADLIDAIPVKRTAGGAYDEDWYWAAPLLIDKLFQPDAAHQWFEQKSLPLLWAGVEHGHDGDRENRWHDHVERARALMHDAVAGKLTLGKPPDDLVDVITWLGLAGPAACSWRSLQRLSCKVSQTMARNLAGQMAHAFLTLFNLPETISLIRGGRGGDVAKKPYWHQVLEYSASGCLQAVLDEYVHVLRESLGRVDASADKTLKDIVTAITTVLRLRTSRVGYDHVLVKPRHHIRLIPQSIRVRFAMRFGKLDAEDGGEPTREDHVRAAFNSPFWPFVLATTSIGQEGLDFHQYCHAVVHWNLPTNPVDLEQREGRVHRYKGHAVRKNIAKRYGLNVVSSDDIWTDLFLRAQQDCASAGSDIVPFWVFQVDGGACIERHVPILPVSSDEYRYVHLKQAVSLYRLAFGQVRQEDLLDFLKRWLPETDIERVSHQLFLNLEPRM